MSESPTAYGERRRGVTAADVERAADALFRVGERPTIEKVRAKLGTGSPNTINPLLDAWWKRLASRRLLGGRSSQAGTWNSLITCARRNSHSCEIGAGESSSS